MTSSKKHCLGFLDEHSDCSEVDPGLCMWTRSYMEALLTSSAFHQSALTESQKSKFPQNSCILLPHGRLGSGGLLFLFRCLLKPGAEMRVWHGFGISLILCTANIFLNEKHQGKVSTPFLRCSADFCVAFSIWIYTSNFQGFLLHIGHKHSTAKISQLYT